MKKGAKFTRTPSDDHGGERNLTPMLEPTETRLQGLLAPEETPRLLLRLPRAEDAETLFRTVRGSHQSLSQFLSWCTQDYALGDAIAWLRDAEAAAHAHQGFHYLLFERLTGDLVGCCGLSEVEPSGAWNLGYWVRKQSEGRGYASEAAHAVLARARQTGAIAKVEIRMLMSNDASQRVAIKSGGRYEGVRDDVIQLQGRNWPALIYVHDFST
jgi:ribosomal-protein-serine acetyltransferase